MFNRLVAFAVLCVVATLPGARLSTVDASEPLVFEAEAYTTPADAWEKNRLTETKWNLWSTDRDAHKKWSGGVVLQSPIVRQDRATPEEGAPPLHTRITGIPAGTYAVELLHLSRPLAVSLDGKNWTRKEGRDNRVGIFTITSGTFELWVDDRYAATPPGSSYYDALVFTPAVPEKLGVVNPDFEHGTEGPTGWRFWAREANTGSAAVAPEGQSGKRAARIRHSGERDWAFTNDGRLNVRPEQLFTVSAWVKGSGNVEIAVVALSGGKTLRWNIGGDGRQATPQWTKLEGEAVVPEECDQIQVRFIGSGKADLLVDSVALREGGRPRVSKPKVNGFAKARIEERLRRGVVAVPLQGGGVYVGWRLLKSDPANVAFNVYRRTGRVPAVRLNEAPITRTTDFVDPQPPQGEQAYYVRPVVDGREGPGSEVATVVPTAEGRAYLSIKLDGTHTFQKVGIADLDGDGLLDFVIKQPNTNVDPYEKYWKRSTNTYKLEAYRSDGTFLWRYDLGWAIECGIWYSPYVVFDFDGDGRAEVAVKTGEGDPRDPDGRVTSGPEYLSILDGRTGKERTRVEWPSREGFPNYNYACRNQLGIAYLDGKTPCLIVERGTYNTIKVVAYEYRAGKLRELWRWDDRESGARYRGQGAHILRAADVDGDGRDEVILGSAVLDDDGTGLWSTGLGHPDNLTVGDLDPERPGLEIQYGIETRNLKNSICMVDAKTGKILWGLQEPSTHIHGSGLCADIDPRYPGVESYQGEADFKEKRWLYSAKGEVIDTRDLGGLAPRAAYWDADLQRELVTGGRIRDYNGGEHAPRIEGSVIAIADILGDWREEVITSLPGEMRIYTTTIPATDRRVCLLQDPIYRLDVAGAAQGYTQIPGLSQLPVATSPTLSLILPPDGLPPEGEATGEALIIASADEGVRGTLRLEARGVAISPTETTVDVPAGKTGRVAFTIRAPSAAEPPARALARAFLSGAPRSSAEIRATIAGTEIGTEVRLPMQRRPLEGVPLVQAEEFVLQQGGSVQIRTDKAGVVGKAFSHWDDAGHRLAWKLAVPRAGRYFLALRYSCPQPTARELRIEGAEPAGPLALTLPATGGFGDLALDWAYAPARATDGKPLLFNVKAGECTLTLTNIDGQGLNLDYLALIPADVGEAR